MVDGGWWMVDGGGNMKGPVQAHVAQNNALKLLSNDGGARSGTWSAVVAPVACNPGLCSENRGTYLSASRTFSLSSTFFHRTFFTHCPNILPINHLFPTIKIDSHFLHREPEFLHLVSRSTKPAAVATFHNGETPQFQKTQ